MTSNIDTFISQIVDSGVEEGGIGIDVDGTLLSAPEEIARLAAETGESEHDLEQLQVERAVEAVTVLLEKAPVSIHPGKRFEDVWNRFGPTLCRRLESEGNLDTITRLTLYPQGGSRKVGFRARDGRVEHIDDPDYDKQFEFAPSTIEAVETIVNEMANDGSLLKFYRDAIEETLNRDIRRGDGRLRISDEVMANSLEEAFRENVASVGAVDGNVDWIRRDRTWRVERFYDGAHEMKRSRRFPWLEVRRGAGDIVVQLTLRTLAVKLTVQIKGEVIQIDTRNQVLDKLAERIASGVRLPRNASARSAGFEAIDIGVGKDYGLRDSGATAYIGDNFGGNDAPALLVDDLLLFSVGDPTGSDARGSDRVISIGDSPESTWRFMKQIAERCKH